MATAAEVMAGQRMTKARAEALTEPGRYQDGMVMGLFLRIAPGGSKQWIQRVRINGVRVDKGLGPFPRVGIAEARNLAERNRALIHAGEDPWAGKQQVRAEAAERASVQETRRAMPTFLEAARLTDAALAIARKPGAKKTEKWLRSLELHAKVLHNTPLDRITRDDVVAAVKPIWLTHYETAEGVFRRIRQVLNYGLEHRLLSENVANGSFKFSLPPQPKLQRGHQRAAPWQDIPDIVSRVRASMADDVTKRATEFVVLTAGRSAEIREAKWSEVDWDSATWTIPAGRMKGTRTGRRHVVPLSRQALHILEEQAAGGSASEYIFVARKGKHLSENTITNLLERIGAGSTAHGLRSAFGGWTDDTGEDHRLAEMCLAHTVKNAVEAAYYRTDILDRRRELLQRWADFTTRS